MQIIIKTKNLELTGKLQSFINNRIESLKKFIKVLKEDNLIIGKRKTLAEVFVEIEKENKHHKKGDIFKAEAILLLPGKKLLAEAHGEDLERVVIKIRDELKREIRKYKTKTVELPRRKYRKLKRNF